MSFCERQGRCNPNKGKKPNRRYFEMSYKKPAIEENNPYICGFSTAVRVPGRFDLEMNLVQALYILLNKAMDKHGFKFLDKDWIGFKGNDFERFFIMEKIGDYASMKVKDYSDTGAIELICCKP